MQHIIKKQIINLSLDKKLDAFHIQQLVSSYYINKVVPVLQKAFDDACSAEETITLDTLEIDLGIINVMQIEKGNWDDEVFKKITEQLIPVKHGLSNENVKMKSGVFSISAQWIFYMQHGYLPWNVLQTNTLWYNKVLESFAADATAISKLRNLIRHYPNSKKRIIFQHSEFFLKALIETLTAENEDALTQLMNDAAEIISLLNKNKLSFDEKQVKQKLWEQVLDIAASGEKNLTPLKITIQVLTTNLSDKQISKKALKDFLLKNNIDASALKKIKEEKNIFSENKILKKEVTETAIESVISAIDEEGIYIINAGMVLLHPFLPQFFKNLNLVNGESFVDKLSHQKALYLLHYLSTGNTAPEEHELVMAKVLCAYPLEEPVDKFIELRMDELQEADNLLMSAIQQWEILKGTSVNGLREGFLQRNGKLFTKNNNLHLQVEANSIDVLLDQLPWNLSLVKLAWMKEFLKVEWR